MTVTQDRIPHARIVTPSVTFEKHEFRIQDLVAEVRRGPDVKRVMLITEDVGTYPDATYRLVGLVDGTPEIWRVDNQGCGCGMAVSEIETPENEVPV